MTNNVDVDVDLFSFYNDVNYQDLDYILIDEDWKLLPMSKSTIEMLCKNPKKLEEYLEHLHRTYNRLVDIVNVTYNKNTLLERKYGHACPNKDE